MPLSNFLNWIGISRRFATDTKFKLTTSILLVLVLLIVEAFIYDSLVLTQWCQTKCAYATTAQYGLATALLSLCEPAYHQVIVRPAALIISN